VGYFTQIYILHGCQSHAKKNIGWQPVTRHTCTFESTCITRRNYAPDRKEKALHNLATRLKKYNDNNACLCVRQTMIHLRFAVIRHTRKMAHFIVCRRVAQQREIYLYHFSALLCQTLTR
jgi:hypothetical protein